MIITNQLTTMNMEIGKKNTVQLSIGLVLGILACLMMWGTRLQNTAAGLLEISGRPNIPSIVVATILMLILMITGVVNMQNIKRPELKVLVFLMDLWIFAMLISIIYSTNGDQGSFARFTHDSKNVMLVTLSLSAVIFARKGIAGLVLVVGMGLSLLHTLRTLQINDGCYNLAILLILVSFLLQKIVNVNTLLYDMRCFWTHAKSTFRKGVNEIQEIGKCRIPANAEPLAARIEDKHAIEDQMTSKKVIEQTEKD